MEKVPARSAEHLVRSVTEDVDDGVRGVEDASVGGEILSRSDQRSRRVHNPLPGDIPWMVMKVVSMMAGAGKQRGREAGKEASTTVERDASMGLNRTGFDGGRRRRALERALGFRSKARVQPCRWLRDSSCKTLAMGGRGIDVERRSKVYVAGGRAEDFREAED